MDDKRDPGVDSDDIIMQQYPSPTADGHDLSFYGANPRDHPPIDPQMEHQPDQPEPPTPGHQHRRPSVSAEELQLAAQLSQGLAPMMGGGHAADQQAQNHDPSLHGQDHGLTEHDIDLQHQDASLSSSMMQHHHDQAAHQYGEAPQPDQQLSQPMQIAQLAQQFAATSAAESIPPRKRSKVSRACDECRRKKVKCDASADAPNEPCTNCKKAQILCLFSRVPQKRGPSKGYIKELADRINSIEGRIGSQALAAEGLDLSVSRRESGDNFSPPGHVNENSKRPYSSISGDTFNTPVADRHAGWASSEPRQPFKAPSNPPPPYSVNRLAPRPAEHPPPARPEENFDDLQLLARVDQPRDLEDSVLAEYDHIIHHTLPILPCSKARILEDLTECPPLLRDAFIEALNAAVRSFKSLTVELGSDARSANRSLFDWENDVGERSSITALVHLQTLILLAIEADNHGPAGRKGAKTSFLARAVAIAYSMGLRQAQVDATFDPSHDPDKNDRLALRAWYALVALDRWNAMATGEPLLIPQDTVVLSQGIRPLLGAESAFQFIKLSYLMGPLVNNLATSERGAPAGYGRTLNTMGEYLDTALEMWRLDLSPTVTPASHPLVFLAYWQVSLLNHLMMPSSLSSDVLWSAKEPAKILSTHPQVMSPFNHYLVSLPALILAELTKVTETRDDATEVLVNDILEAPTPASSWDPAMREVVLAKIRPSTSSDVAATASQSLQRLADLAAATTEIPTANAGPPAENQTDIRELRLLRPAESYEEMGFDPRPMLRAGYLNALRAAA